MAKLIYSEIFRLMRQDINEAKNKGLENFTIDQLFAWVDLVEISLKELDTGQHEETPQQAQERIKRDNEYKVSMTKWIEKVKHINASNLEGIKFHQAGQLEVFKGAMRFAEIALKGAVLINGGAAVAFLAFIGTLWTGSNENPESLLKLTGPLMLFVWGVFLGAISSGIAYLTQICYAEGSQKLGNVLRVFAVLSVFGTYVCFFMGASEASEIFSAPMVESVKESVSP